MPTAPPVTRGFSPLDEELHLLAGPFTPSVVESIVRLGTWMPFVPVTKGLDYFLKVNLSEPTARRKTEQAGQAYVEVQAAQGKAIERDESAPPRGPERLQISVDGAMVPLVNKQWGEVKTLAIGVVEKPVWDKKKGEWTVHTAELSYFSRMTDHETFAWAATVETHRRGTETAGTVCAINDGAEWEQKFVDLHRPDAVRILDWGHSAEHVGEVARARYGQETSAGRGWPEGQLRELKQGDSEKVLAELRRLREALASGREEGVEAEALQVVIGNLEYFEKRAKQIRYAAFEGAGYPIGSGAVESANKLVVEARLKGSGMHWAPQHVDPMVALRTVACSDRWEEAWPQISERLREQTKERAATRRCTRKAAKAANGEEPVEVTVGVMTRAATPPEPAGVLAPSEPKPVANRPEEQPKPGPRRPAADHPWRRMAIGRACRR